MATHHSDRKVIVDNVVRHGKVHFRLGLQWPLSAGLCSARGAHRCRCSARLCDAGGREQAVRTLTL